MNVSKERWAVYAVFRRRGGGRYFVRVGDGEGRAEDSQRLRLDAIPTSGELVVRRVYPEFGQAHQGQSRPCA